MQIFQGNEQELKARFNLAPMVIVWVGILRSKKVFLTEPFLELCHPGGPMEPLVKDRSLLMALENQEKFQKIQQQYDKDRQYPLTLIDEGEKRILALEDELTAEMGWRHQEPSQLPQQVVEMAITKPEPYLQGLETLFSPDEIARLKVAIATTVKPEEKVEAIRKMSMAQVPVREKGILFLHALGDCNIQVRSEAAQAMRQIGFNQAISEAISTLGSGDEKQREYALSSLSQLFSAASEVEKGAILQTLLTVLRDKEYHKHYLQILDILVKLAPQFPMTESLAERLLSLTMEILVSRFDEVMEKASHLFRSMLHETAELTKNFLRAEIRKSEMRRVRCLLLTLLSESDVKEIEQEELARQIVFEIGLGDELDPVYMRLTAALFRFKEHAVESLLERFKNSVRITERMQGVRILDKILREAHLDAGVKNRVFKAYSESISTAPHAFCMVLLDTPLLMDPEVSASLKTEFAVEALVDIHSNRLDQFYEAVRSALCRIKKPALAAIVQVLRKPLHPQQAIRASNILGDVILQLGAEDYQEILEIKNFCLEQLANTPEHRGELFKVLGKIVASAHINTEIASELTEYLLERLCKTSYPYDVLEALGWASAGEFTTLELKTDIGYLFTTLMDKKMPEHLFHEKEVGGETIFECNFQTDAYTDLLPVLITGMGRLAAASTTPEGLRKRVQDYLLKKWQALITYRVVWGPKNTTDMAEVMRNLCVHDRISLEDRLALANALYQKVDVWSVTDLLTTVFDEKNATDEFASLASQVANKILEFINSEDYNNHEDQSTLIQYARRMMDVKRLAVQTQDADDLREKLLYALFDGMRKQIFGAKELLLELQEHPLLSERMQKELKKRLPAR